MSKSVSEAGASPRPPAIAPPGERLEEPAVDAAEKSEAADRGDPPPPENPSRRTPTPRPVTPVPRIPRRADEAPSAPRPVDPPFVRETPRPPRSAGPPPITAHLSPRMTAVFGGLFGLATVASIIALLIQATPPKDERAAAASASAMTSASAAAAKAESAPVTRKPKRVPIPGPWRISELQKDPSVTMVSGEMEHDSFVDALGDKNVPTPQIYRIMKAFEDVKTFDKAGKHDKFTVAMEKGSKRVKAFEYEVSKSEIYQARENDKGLLDGVKLDLKIEEHEVSGAFYVGSDIKASYDEGGFEDGILEAINDALGSRMSTDAFEEGAVVKVIAVEETALGMFSRYKRILALEYDPPDTTQPPLKVYSFVGQEAHGYFDEKGKQPSSGGWVSPVPGPIVVTSPFNPKRMHPVLHVIMPHEGTDLRAPTGTPITSAYKGVIASAGPLGPCGNAVVIDHPNGIQTGYCHLSRIAPGIKPGEKVAAHQLVGYSGATGRAKGPHLHFFAKKHGQFFDSATLLQAQERVLPGADRPAFLEAKAALDQRLAAIPTPEPPPKPEPAAPPAPSSSAATASTSNPAPNDSAAPPTTATPADSAAPAADHGSVDPGDDDDDKGGVPIQGAQLGGVPMGPAPNVPKGEKTKSKE